GGRVPGRGAGRAGGRAGAPAGPRRPGGGAATAGGLGPRAPRAPPRLHILLSAPPSPPLTSKPEAGPNLVQSKAHDAHALRSTTLAGDQGHVAAGQGESAGEGPQGGPLLRAPPPGAPRPRLPGSPARSAPPPA